MRYYTDQHNGQTLQMIELRDNGQGVFAANDCKYQTRITCNPAAFFIEPKRLLPQPPRHRPLMEQILVNA